MPIEKYVENKERLSRWRCKPIITEPPMLPSNQRGKFRPIDYEKMEDILFELDENERSEFRKAADWGHILIDEGQDFPKTLYGFLRVLRKVVFGVDGETGSSAITVSADDNQRLDSNSNTTIGQIKEILGVPQDRCFMLTTNYRNTKQIALFCCSISG